jgi:hypothetical protein
MAMRRIRIASLLNTKSIHDGDFVMIKVYSFQEMTDRHLFNVVQITTVRRSASSVSQISATGTSKQEF